jgi:hypothetical protein
MIYGFIGQPHMLAQHWWQFCIEANLQGRESQKIPKITNNNDPNTQLIVA